MYNQVKPNLTNNIPFVLKTEYTLTQSITLGIISTLYLHIFEFSSRDTIPYYSL